MSARILPCFSALGGLLPLQRQDRDSGNRRRCNNFVSCEQGGGSSSSARFAHSPSRFVHDVDSLSGQSSGAAPTLLWRPLARGRCLDGSPAGFYTSTRKSACDGGGKFSTAREVFLYLQPGGWCAGADRRSTIIDACDRARTPLGSSKSFEKEMATPPFLKRGKSFPEHMELVYVPYCDGTSFCGNAVLNLAEEEIDLKETTGTSDTVRKGPTLAAKLRINEERKLYFEGRLILDELLSALKELYPHMERLVVCGASSGGAAVMFHLDRIDAAINGGGGDDEIEDRGQKKKRTEVVGVSDGGFFLNLNSWRAENVWPNEYAQLFELTNGWDSLPDRCLKAVAAETEAEASAYASSPAASKFKTAPVFDEREKCLYPENFVHAIERPVFLMQSLYDSSVVEYTLDVRASADRPDREYLNGPKDKGARARAKQAEAKQAGSAAAAAPAAAPLGKTVGEPELRAVKRLRKQHLEAMEPLLQREDCGHWLVNCVAHTLLGKFDEDKLNEKNTITEGKKPTGCDEALLNWLKGDRVKLVDENDWVLGSRSKYCWNGAKY